MEDITFLDVALSLIITVFLYLLFPVILVIRGKKYKASTINKIVIINGMVVVAIFSAIKGEPGTGGFVLWTAVAYWLLKKKCLLVQPTQQTAPKTSYSISPLKPEQNKHSNQIYGSDIALQKEEQQETPPQPVVEQVVEQPKKEKKPTPPKWMVVYHICLLIFVCFLAITNIYQYEKSIDYSEYILMQQEEYNSLSENYEKLSEGYEKMKDNNLELTQELHKYKYQNWEKLNFMDECVAIIEDDGTDWYHKYECERFKGNGFWVYTDIGAKERGYSPCPYCH